MEEENGSLISEIKALLGDGGMTQKAAITLILKSQINQLKDTSALRKKMGEIDNRFIAIEKNVAEIVREQAEYPSLLWLLRYKTKKTMTFLLSVTAIILLLSYVIITNESFKEMLITFLGL